MDKKIVGVIGAITGLAVIDQVQAAPPATPLPDAVSARSYAALLDPIPNAVAALRAAEAAWAREAQSAAPGGDERQMRVAGMKHHHSHHHHHRVKKPPKTHDHHHHHHHFST